ESPICVLDGKTNEYIHCETVELYPRKCRMVMDMEVFKEHADTFPIVLDRNIQKCDNYEFMRGHIYKEKNGLLSSDERLAKQKGNSPT
ncbi:9787_t:CDS:2, partial [Cetraspora pellucida]